MNEYNKNCAAAAAQIGFSMKKLLLLTLLSSSLYSMQPTVKFMAVSGTIFVASIANTVRLIKNDQGKKISPKPIQSTKDVLVRAK